MAGAGDSGDSNQLNRTDAYSLESLPQCIFCYWHVGANECRAFGEKPIPTEILENRVLHTTPYPGDRGRMFVRVSTWTRPLKNGNDLDRCEDQGQNLPRARGLTAGAGSPDGL